MEIPQEEQNIPPNHKLNAEFQSSLSIKLYCGDEKNAGTLSNHEMVPSVEEMSSDLSIKQDLSMPPETKEPSTTDTKERTMFDSFSDGFRTVDAGMKFVKVENIKLEPLDIEDVSTHGEILPPLETKELSALKNEDQNKPESFIDRLKTDKPECEPLKKKSCTCVKLENVKSEVEDINPGNNETEGRLTEVGRDPCHNANCKSTREHCCTCVKLENVKMEDEDIDLDNETAMRFKEEDRLDRDLSHITNWKNRGVPLQAELLECSVVLQDIGPLLEGHDGKITMKAITDLTHKGIHTEEKRYSYSCHVCRKSFTRLCTLDKHRKIHTVGKALGNGTDTDSDHEKPKRKRKRRKFYRCDVCGRACLSLKVLQTHRTLHTGEKPFTCDVCGKAFRLETYLEKHKKMHTNERPFVCDVCGKGFIESSRLEAHRTIHSEEKPHCCSVCGKAFRLKINLQEHERYHTGERPFVCDICGQAFYAKSPLTRHKIRRHTMEKPYFCDVCGKAFSHPANLHEHRTRPRNACGTIRPSILRNLLMEKTKDDFQEWASKWENVN